MIFSYGLHHMDEQMLDDQLELIYNSSVWTQDDRDDWRKRIG